MDKCLAWKMQVIELVAKEHRDKWNAKLLNMSFKRVQTYLNSVYL
jgi:DNA-binding CsgD family transcriptional regulator